MIRKALHSLLLRRHFWRYATFSEIAELYTARVLHLAAQNISSSFMSVFMYQAGVPIYQIGLFWAGFYFFKMLISLPLASLVGRIGPKHATLLANILYIPAMAFFALSDGQVSVALFMSLALQGAAGTLYGISHQIGFSKVKNIEHAGKEIGYMNIFEKLTIGLSPLIGGLLALIVGPQIVVAISAVLFALAAAPLLRTGEVVQTGRKLVLRGFTWRLFLPHAPSSVAMGFDTFASGTVWYLFTAIIIIGTVGDGVYAANGLLMSTVLLSAILASFVYGKIIDRRRGRQLMYAGVIANALTHFVRPFTGSMPVAAAVNIANEAATTAFVMPYTRGYFDNADISGLRITYMGLQDMSTSLGAGLCALVLAGWAYFWSPEAALTHFFFLSGAVALVVLTARFPLYKK